MIWRLLDSSLGNLEITCVTTSWSGHTNTKYIIMHVLNILAPELFFLILAHSVYKMWIIQEPNTLELWNKLHFEEKKTEIIYHV